jgi:glutaredoxin
VNPEPPSVTIYSLPGCLLCRRVKSFLTAHAVSYNEVNVLTKPRVLAKVVLGYRKLLPVVVIGDQVLAGWSRRRLAAAIRSLKTQAL